MLLKIAPDLNEAELDGVAGVLLGAGVDGLICTNTTIARDAVTSARHAGEAGGLSGKPLFDKSTAVLRGMVQRLCGKVPVIGVGGILSGSDAATKTAAGREPGSVLQRHGLSRPGVDPRMCRGDPVGECRDARMNRPITAIASEPGYTVVENAPLLARNMFHVPARAELLIDVNRSAALPALFDLAALKSGKVLVLGAGSNVLFTRDWPGVVLALQSMGIRILEDRGDAALIRVEAGGELE